MYTLSLNDDIPSNPPTSLRKLPIYLKEKEFAIIVILI